MNEQSFRWLVEYTQQIGNAYRKAMLAAGIHEYAVDDICTAAGDDVVVWVERSFS